MRGEIRERGGLITSFKKASETRQNPTSIAPHWFGLDFGGLKCYTDIVPKLLIGVSNHSSQMKATSKTMHGLGKIGALVKKAICLYLIVGFQPHTVAQEVSFSRDIRPLLNEHCMDCHGGVKQAGDLSFKYRSKVFDPAKSGAIAVVPGRPDESELIARIIAQDEDDIMPPPDAESTLSEQEIQMFRQWIQQGAVWNEHWAFMPPENPEQPQVSNPDWCSQGLDYFVLSELDRHQIEPTRAASRRSWLRRASLDLTGLPPSTETIDAFLLDQEPGAFERMTDRLLNASAFGERWASMWLDLARYADSQGYEKDGKRTMWPYRDWLIRAFNADLPYDQFTRMQLAGDLLPSPTMDDLIATGFHRNTPTNTEGGTDDEEFRVTAILDRVNTTWQVWQGITFNCVQCHAHPYDPIDQPEYYQFMSYFNTSMDWDLRSDDPKLNVPLSTEDFEKARGLDVEISKLSESVVHQTRQIVEQSQDWLWLKPEHAVSTKQTKLRIQPFENGGADVITEGTVSHDSQFTLDFQIPDGVETITALRMDVLPRDPEKALYEPELGFVISEFKAQIGESSFQESSAADPDESKEGEDGEKVAFPGQIKFRYALGDEAEAFYNARETLQPSKQGWGAMPRITHARRLVLLPESPIQAPASGYLRIIIRQEAAPNDLAPFIANRSRYALSIDERWTQLAKDEAFQQQHADLAELEKQRRSVPSSAQPYLREQYVSFKRGTAVFKRGDWLNKGEAVEPGLPDILASAETSDPKDRLGLANWLVSDQNTLTARVMVNRLWEQLFGSGIVPTLGDFGSSGQPPNNPALLDYLAHRFQQELNWSVKGILREMVLSATYRQAATVTDELRAKDPDNRLLARGPRTRLTAEMVRDSALFASGKLSYKMYGPPVMPWQPDGIWRAARSSLKWETSKGEDQYRRAIYTFWRRSNPYPSMIAFDAPNRLICNTRRVSTNTPLQALVTMNDPVYMECASALARNMHSQAGGDLSEKIRFGWHQVLGQTPSSQDLSDLMDLYESALATYDANPDLAKRLNAEPAVAALTLVANTLLNMDSFLTK